MDDISIKVTIGSREYPLKIKRQEEQNIMKAAQMLNERISDYEKQYAVTDKLDLVAMCAMQFATELVNFTDASVIENTKIADAIATIDTVIAAGLKKNIVP